MPTPVESKELLAMAKALLVGAAAVWAFYAATLVTIIREIVLREPKLELVAKARWGILVGVAAFMSINGGALYLLQYQAFRLIEKTLPSDFLVPNCILNAGHAWLLVGHFVIDVAILIAVHASISRRS